VPHYFVDHSCVNTIREHNNYRSKEPVKGQNVPEFGTKMDDHTLDAIRYGLLYIYKLGCTTSLAEVYGPSQWRPEMLQREESITDSLHSGFHADSNMGGFGNMEGVSF
jgi:hypothetical protein